MSEFAKEINNEINDICKYARLCDVGQLGTHIKTVMTYINEQPQYFSKSFINTLDTLYSYTESATSAELTKAYQGKSRNILVEDASNLRETFKMRGILS